MKKSFEQLTRYALIVQCLRGDDVYVMPDDLISYMERACGVRSVDFPPSRDAAIRTLQRDFKDISSLMNVEIVFVKNKGYHIASVDGGATYRYEQLLSDFDLLMAIQPDSDLSHYVIAEHHRPKGSENIYPLLGAIKERRTVEFDYTFVRHGDTVRHYVVEPHYLKENQQLWYLIAKDNSGLFKLFGIDRITNLGVSEDTDEFERDESYDPHAAFADCYGIWNDPSMPIEDIELSYDALDGSFLKRNPLHSSQATLVDTAEEFRISLRLRITNDFVMALLSRSRSLTVIRPASLRERIYDICRKASERNS